MCKKYNYLVIASTTGYTACKFEQIIKDLEINAIVCKQNLNDKLKMSLEAEVKIKSFSEVVDIPRGYLRNLIGLESVNLLRCFSQGHKVCAELVLFLINKNKLKPGDNIMVITGTVIGADTAIEVLVKQNKRFKIKRVICMSIN